MLIRLAFLLHFSWKKTWETIVREGLRSLGCPKAVFEGVLQIFLYVLEAKVTAVLKPQSTGIIYTD